MQNPAAILARPSPSLCQHPRNKSICTVPEPRAPTCKGATLHQAWTERWKREKNPQSAASQLLTKAASAAAPSEQAKTSRVRSGRKGKQTDRNTEVGRELGRSPSPTPPLKQGQPGLPPSTMGWEKHTFPRGQRAKYGLGSLQLTPLPPSAASETSLGPAGICSGAHADFSLQQLSCVLVKFLDFISSKV